jgi:hypothetical protein
MDLPLQKTLTPADEAKRIAAEALPCKCRGETGGSHWEYCPTLCRPAVESAVSKLLVENEELGRGQIELAHELCESQAMTKRLMVENEKLRGFIADLIVDHRPLTEADIRRGQEIAKELGTSIERSSRP